MKKIIEVKNNSLWCAGCENCVHLIERWSDCWDNYIEDCSASEEQQDYCFANNIHYEEVEE